jgi:hypothetical protein
VANAITPTVTQAMMLMALALFFARKYLHRETGVQSTSAQVEAPA